jgi:hypothetical protein
MKALYTSKGGFFMKALFALICVSFLSSLSFGDVSPLAGFKNGNDLSIKEISGDVTYLCRDNMGNNYSRHWDCVADDVTPGTHAYLVTVAKVDADKVTLTST